MVKKMVVLLSALGFILTMAGMAGAFYPCVFNEGDIIVVPMKVKTTFTRTTGPGPVSALFTRGCDQYTNDFYQWGAWKGTVCTMRVQVIPPKCVAPAVTGPAQWGAPMPAMPGSKLVKADERYGIVSPGCNPCVEGGLEYSVRRQQAVR